MPSLLDLFDAPRTEPQRIVSGVIARTASNEKLGLWVKIPAFDDLDEPPKGEKRRVTQWGPCPWRPQVEEVFHEGFRTCRIVFPTIGDPCWVEFDQEDRPVVTCYWPKTGYERLPRTDK